MEKLYDLYIKENNSDLKYDDFLNLTLGEVINILSDEEENLGK